MPLLDNDQIQELLELAKVHGVCRECGQQTAQDYDRTQDEFYWIHAPGCTMYQDRGGHRLTIVPYVEDRGGGLSGEYKKPMTRKLMFFPNGNTAALHNEQQVPLLQRPWVEIFANWLEQEMGEDPAEYRLLMPNGKGARFFRTTDGRWNWRFE